MAGVQEKAGAVCGPVPLNIYNFDDITDSFMAGGIISLLDATKAYKSRKHLEILILFPKIQKCFDVTGLWIITRIQLTIGLIIRLEGAIYSNSYMIKC